MKQSLKHFSLVFLIILSGCNRPGSNPAVVNKHTPLSENLSPDQANRLAELPLACLQTEYPNKLGQTLGSSADLGEPHILHPAFFGCFDWHSAVHGHWSLVKLLKEFPELENAKEIRGKLKENISFENIAGELEYFEGEHNTTYERTYGWAWLLKLAEELHTWDDPLARELEANLQPLTDLIVLKFIEFLPKLVYPIRVGEHTNTAFALAFAWDYAVSVKNRDLESAIESRALEFYQDDIDCPFTWEPGGFDFLSPCLEEIDLMRRILDEERFSLWLDTFAPGLSDPEFQMVPGIVSDRTDGKLVHIDGLNFSRAWVLKGLAKQYPERYKHLDELAELHINYSLPNLFGDGYEGGHWLGTFAIYALN